MAVETPFTPDHSDRLTVLQLNDNGSKLLTASVDHRVAVYDVDDSTHTRKQLEVFTAHDSEIRDAKWFHPSTGTHFVTVANDLQLRIWSQDIYQAPMSGRRFRRIATIKSQQLVPFSSVDVKTVGNSTYLAVIDRQGLLSLYEPTNPDEYNEWSLVDQFHVHEPAPGRGDHTSFRVRFDPNPFPLPFLNDLSEDQAQLTLAVTSMSEVKLYRSSSEPEVIKSYISSQQQSVNVGRGASRSMCLFEVLQIQAPSPQHQPSAGQLLRDVAFSPGNVRGSDVLAVASINGTVAIYDITVHTKNATQANSASKSAGVKQLSSRPTPQLQQSNLTSALHPVPSTPQVSPQALSRANHPFPYNHHVTPVSILEDAHIDTWSVQWDSSGQCLLSSGSNGTVKIWKRAVGLTGLEGFELFAEQTAEEETESEADSNEEDEQDAS